MPRGFLSLVLHAHLPFVRHPEYTDFFEEQWLFEAITETYIPILQRWEKLAAEGIPCRLTISLSPTLTAMLQDELLQQRYLNHMANLVELAEKEVDRTRQDPTYGLLAESYLDWFRETIDLFENKYQRDLVSRFAALQDAGAIEIMTCAATHGFLPALKTAPAAVRAQVLLGQESYRRCFGRPANGIWLPECGYYPGLEDVLKEAGLTYFIVDSHGLLHASVRPHYGLRAPVACPNGVAAFARDPESSRQVWSADEGYPGDVDYREFYRDIGFDLDFQYMKPHILDGATRVFTGIKYHRITGKSDDKQPYRPAQAATKVRQHAQHFLEERETEFERAGPLMDRPPHVLSPYDAELFGHWWFEGPQFLETLARISAEEYPELEWVTPTDYLEQFPLLQRSVPSASSWGFQGFSDFWVSGANAWIYPHLHRGVRRLTDLATLHRQEADGTDIARALNQAARSLLIAQASDWTFILKTGTSVEYAEKRIRDHLSRFQYLCDAVEKGEVDPHKLAALEAMDNVFPFLDFRTWGAYEEEP